jgi:hypothetical protein
MPDRFFATLKGLRPSEYRNPFRVAKIFKEACGPRVAKPTLGWNSPTLSALETAGWN